ncbi:MAG: ABC transporter substrate-binding protein [Pseudolabrys sp.]
MRRRDFTKGIAVSVAIWPCAARAQRAGEPVIGFLSARSAKESEHLVDAFRKGMAEQGIVERQNAAVDYRWADSRYKRLAGQAADLLSRQPTVLVSVGGDMTAKVATAATRTTPIVAVFIGDPVAGGFVTSLSRPGGNITGVSNSNAVIEAKRLGLLREVKPGIETVGVLLNPSSATAPSQQKESRKRCERSGSKCSFSKPATTQNLRPLLDSSLIIGYPRCSCRPMHFLRPPGTSLPSWRRELASLRSAHCGKPSLPVGS